MPDSNRDPMREEVAMLNTKIESLSDVLEAKGITTQAEWENKIKENVNAK